MIRDGYEPQVGRGDIEDMLLRGAEALDALGTDSRQVRGAWNRYTLLTMCEVAQSAAWHLREAARTIEQLETEVERFREGFLAQEAREVEAAAQRLAAEGEGTP